MAGVKSHRIKETAAAAGCVMSAAVGWSALKNGVQFGNVVCALGVTWTVCHWWLTGQWRRKVRRKANGADIEQLRDSPLGQVISCGATGFFLMQVYWFISFASQS